MITALFVLLVFPYVPFVFCSRFCWVKLPRLSSSDSFDLLVESMYKACSCPETSKRTFLDFWAKFVSNSIASTMTGKRCRSRSARSVISSRRTKPVSLFFRRGKGRGRFSSKFHETPNGTPIFSRRFFEGKNLRYRRIHCWCR